MIEVPEGYEPFPKDVGFANAIDPVFVRRVEHGVELGMPVAKQHLNGYGICHGGVLMLLADICASWNLRSALGDSGGGPTLSLSFDFIRAARDGDWVDAVVEQMDLKRSVGFASGSLRVAGERVARFNGSFYLAAGQRFQFSDQVEARYRNTTESIESMEKADER